MLCETPYGHHASLRHLHEQLPFFLLHIFYPHIVDTTLKDELLFEPRHHKNLLLPDPEEYNLLNLKSLVKLKLHQCPRPLYTFLTAGTDTAG